MSIKELENELKELKAYAYDLNSEYAKFTQRIDAVTEEIKNLKENGKEVEIKNKDIVIPQVNETNDVVKMEESNNSTANDIHNANEELTTTEPIENNKTQEVEQDEIETQIQDPSKDIISTPLIPTVEIPQSQVETNEVSNKNNVIITKVDANLPKAIVTTVIQTDKLRKSEELNESIVLGSGEQQVVKSPEEEMKEMMDQAQQLYAEGKTLEAQQLTEKVFNKTTAN